MRFLLRRIGFFLVTLWAAMTLNFFIPKMMPGNPLEALKARTHGKVSGQALEQLLTSYGYKPNANVFTQYLDYLGNMLTGKFGISIGGGTLGTPVSKIIGENLYWTMGLVGVTTILAFALGSAIGVIAAWRRGGALDSVLPSVFVVTSALPYFFVGLVLIVVFSNTLNILPASGHYDSSNLLPGFSPGYIGSILKYAILPSLAILITSIGGWILTMRNNMITVLTEDYVRMARAKGLRPWRIMWTYAGRNAILPNLVGFAMSLGFVVGGAILVEFVFNYPGVGWMFLQSVENQDYALMQGLFLMITVTVLLAVLAADVATAILDPRTRERG